MPYGQFTSKHQGVQSISIHAAEILSDSAYIKYMISIDGGKTWAEDTRIPAKNTPWVIHYGSPVYDPGVITRFKAYPGVFHRLYISEKYGVYGKMYIFTTLLELSRINCSDITHSVKLFSDSPLSRAIADTSC